MFPRNIAWRPTGTGLLIQCLALVIRDVQSQNSKPSVPTVVVEVGIVYDKEFNKTFSLGPDKITDFFINQFRNLDLYFITPPNTKISFSLTSVNILDASSESVIITNSKYENETTDLFGIRRRLQSWAYINKMWLKNDVILLVTGTRGKHVYSNVLSGVCSINHDTTKYQSVIAVRMAKNLWISRHCLAQSFAELLGATLDKTMNSIWMPNSTYIFSMPSDAAIHRRVTSWKANCLRKFQGCKNLLTESRQVVLPLTRDEECKVKYQNANLIADNYTAETSCLRTACISKKSKINVGHIIPTYKTPCDQNKVGDRCIPHGVVIRNVNTNKCLVGANTFLADDITNLSECPKKPSKLDEFMLLEKKDDGLYLAMVYNNAHGQDKCLTVDVDEKTVKFEVCPIEISENLLWDLVDLENGRGQFLLCHRSTRKCSGVHGETVIVTDPAEAVSLELKRRWTFYGNDSVSNDYRKFIKRETQNIEYANYYNLTFPIPDVVLEKETVSQTPLLIWSIMGTTVILAVVSTIGLIFVYIQKRKARQIFSQRLEEYLYEGAAVENINPELGIASQANLLPFDRKWEFPKEKLKLGKTLGSGAFGIVVQAEAEGIIEHGIKTTVAVKMVNSNVNELHLKALVNEVKIMSHLGSHLNVVDLLGVCTKGISKSQVYVLLEYCENGNLKSFLHAHRNQCLNALGYQNDGPMYEDFGSLNDTAKPISIKKEDFLRWSFQIAQGMEYLSSRRVLHGDLAARNVLLAENHVAKITDFGFSRMLNRSYEYTYKKNTKKDVPLPFKWMAPESMNCGMFSSEADCWSYGVVLWEIYTAGDTPYPGIDVDCKFIENISNGFRLQKPPNASNEMYDLMLQCWTMEPSSRPKFNEIVRRLKEILEKVETYPYTKLACNQLQGKHPRFPADHDDLLLRMGNSEVRNSFQDGNDRGSEISNSLCATKSNGSAKAHTNKWVVFDSQDGNFDFV